MYTKRYSNVIDVKLANGPFIAFKNPVKLNKNTSNSPNSKKPAINFLLVVHDLITD